MRTTATLSISDSGRVVKGLLVLWSLGLILSAQYPQDTTIEKIIFKFNQPQQAENTDKYMSLVNVKEGQTYHPQLVRQSIANLYQTGSFDQITCHLERIPPKRINLIFTLKEKYVIKSISITGISNVNLKKGAIKKAIFSIRENSYFEHTHMQRAKEEILKYLQTQGYHKPEIAQKIERNNRNMTLHLKFVIKPNAVTRIEKMIVNIDKPAMKKRMGDYFNTQLYIPVRIEKQVEKLKKKLKKQKYFFPEIRYSVTFLDESKSQAHLILDINLGSRYIFKFEGIQNRMSLITPLWEKKLFERWAVKESEIRILNHLKNRGYLNAQVTSQINITEATKTITFKAIRNNKYTLGNITFSGNQALSEERLRDTINSDDKAYNKLIELQSNSLIIDKEVLKLFYYFSGFPYANIQVIPHFRGQKADINFLVDEGEKYLIDSILYEGNTQFQTEQLQTILKSKANGPFVQQVLNQDIERLKNFYYARGFDDVVIDLVVSRGSEKSILIRITEGNAYRMWNTIIIGASKSQSKLIRRQFPLDKNDYFDRTRLQSFISNIENSAIFNEITVTKIRKQPDLVDVMIKVIPDRSKYYGLGVGLEIKERRTTFRGTLEYSDRNIFNSYSTLAVIFQLGFRERRGVLSYDTPYFLNTDLTSSFKIWNEDEIYPSYKFNRWGTGGSVLKRLKPTSTFIATLSWYRTTLTELLVPEEGIDRLDTPFDTTAINLSYVVEKRDDPFNPITGHFFSSHLKIGLPIFENDHSFFKIFWSYQKNFRLFKRGSLSFSIRNGFASGEVSITERFFAGGLHTFRGTRMDRLGPIDETTDEPVGGNALVLFNFEATIPLFPIPIENLYYSFFADFGNVYTKSSDFDLSAIEKAVGFGLKYRTPIGPLRVDLAWNLRKEGEDNFLVQIGIGNVF